MTHHSILLGRKSDGNLSGMGKFGLDHRIDRNCDSLESLVQFATTTDTQAPPAEVHFSTQILT